MKIIAEVSLNKSSLENHAIAYNKIFANSHKKLLEKSLLNIAKLPTTVKVPVYVDVAETPEKYVEHCIMHELECMFKREFWYDDFHVTNLEEVLAYLELLKNYNAYVRKTLHK